MSRRPSPVRVPGGLKCPDRKKRVPGERCGVLLRPRSGTGPNAGTKSAGTPRRAETRAAAAKVRQPLSVQPVPFGTKGFGGSFVGSGRLFHAHVQIQEYGVPDVSGFTVRVPGLPENSLRLVSAKEIRQLGLETVQKCLQSIRRGCKKITERLLCISGGQ